MQPLRALFPVGSPPCRECAPPTFSVRAGKVELKTERSDMHRQVIEFGGLPVGIAVPDNGALRFIAVKFHVIALDDRRYSSVGELKAAIRDHLRSGDSYFDHVAAA